MFELHVSHSALICWRWENKDSVRAITFSYQFLWPQHHHHGDTIKLTTHCIFNSHDLDLYCTTVHLSLSKSTLCLKYMIPPQPHEGMCCIHCKAKSLSLLLPENMLHLSKRIGLHEIVLILKLLTGIHSSGSASCGIWVLICLPYSQMGDMKRCCLTANIFIPYYVRRKIKCWSLSHCFICWSVWKKSPLDVYFCVWLLYARCRCV